ncbi:MAG: thiamine pyrophosphate central protein, partial [Rhizobacter sp.]|nr:thiamine pyrophosphate central protein [Rhizobacter sp.]
MTARPGSGLLAEIGFEEALVQALGALGVREAYGVSGGAIAALWHAMSASPWRVCHFRHESGAAFAATEASLAAGRPVVVFTTTGPGLTNVLTGITAARSEGAQVILISAVTAPGGHGRHAIQETSPFTMPAEFYTPGAIFDHAAILDTPAALAACLQEVARGLARRQGYVAHLAVPMSHRLPCTVRPERIERAAASPSTVDVERAIALLAGDSFAIWLGFGARAAAGDVARFVERSGAPVFCTPRAKGVLPETHPQFIGVTGIGGHDSVAAWVVACKPARILVLGSRLGEASSMWDARFVPRCGFVHVDVDPDVPGRVYRDVETSAIIADIGAFLRAMLARWPERRGPALPCGPPVTAALSLPHTRHVRPEILMDAVQRQVIDRGSEMVFAESGHAFIWATHRLRFATPGRFRVSTGVGAMGHAACGVVGAA